MLLGIAEKKMQTIILGLGLKVIVPLKKMEYGLYGDLIIIYPKTSCMS